MCLFFLGTSSVTLLLDSHDLLRDNLLQYGIWECLFVCEQANKDEQQIGCLDSHSATCTCRRMMAWCGFSIQICSKMLHFTVAFLLYVYIMTITFCEFNKFFRSHKITQYAYTCTCTCACIQLHKLNCLLTVHGKQNIDRQEKYKVQDQNI